MKRLAVLVVVLALWPQLAIAQSAPLYGQRLASKDGKWLLPVASLHLTSTESDHIKRGSVQAWDITAPKGTPIFPIADGVVEYAGCNNKGGYGCWTYIRHAGGVHTIMGHMVQGSITVQSGQSVSQWDVVGQVGWTGMTSFGPHVHLEIHRPGGGRYNISDFWNAGQMHYQKLGNAQGKEIVTQVGVVGGRATQQTQPQAQPQTSTVTTTAVQTRLAKLLELLRTVKPEIVSMLVVGFLGLLVLVWWLGGMLERIFVVSLGTSVIVVAAGLWLVMPLQVAVQAQSQPVQAGQQVAVSGDWEKAYQIVQGNEGWQCTNDGAYTMGGVTQGTYNRWRAKHGMGSADVCRNLTREQAKAVFYELFWVPVGADKMPFNLALTVVDHYYVTGKVSHLLAQCGQNVACFNQARIVDFRSKRNCNLYCAGWINRVNKIRKYTGG